jgi:hypothetical protein
MASSGPSSIHCRSHVPFASVLWDEYVASTICLTFALFAIPFLVFLILAINVIPAGNPHQGLTPNHGNSKKKPSEIRLAARCISDRSEPRNLAIRWAAWILTTIALGLVVCIAIFLILFALFHQYCVRETAKMSYLVTLWFFAAIETLVATVGLLIWLTRTVLLVFIGPYLGIKRLLTSRAKGTTSTKFTTPDPMEQGQRGNEQQATGQEPPAAAILPPYTMV